VKKKCHDIFQLKIFSPDTLSVPRGLFTGRRHHFVSSVLILEKSFQIEKKRRNKKICVHVCYYNPAPLRDPAWLLSLYYRSSSSSSSRLLYTDNDGGALKTGYCGVQSSGQCLFYFIFLQLIFRQRPPVTWGGGIVSKTGETKTNSTGFIYCFFFVVVVVSIVTRHKRKERERDTVKIEENVRDNYYISGDII
jgi:hypothetical protein